VRQAAGPATGIVGRGPELAALDKLAGALAAGTGALVLIEGASGTGKSTLLAVLEQLAAERQIAVRRATVIEIDADQPFAVIERALGSGVQAALENESAVALAEGGLAAVHRLSHALLAGADAAPVLLCIDDAQWADEQSLRVVEVVASSIRDRRVVVALSWRRAEVAEPRLARLRAVDGVVHLSLEDLAAGDAAALVRRALPDAEDSFVAACCRLTGGNPLLLGEVVTAFAASGRAADGAAAKRLAELAPGSVRKVVLARLGELSSAAIALARAAAVLGDGAPLHQAALLAELEPEAAAAAADGLVAVEVFAPADTLAFRHPLHRSAVLEDIGGFTRSEMYRRAATLVASDGMFERAGALLLRAAPGGDQGAVTTLRRAAVIARGSGDARTTIRLLERALAEPAAPEERPALLVDLARAEVATGDPASVDHLDTALREIDRADERAEILRSLARLHHARYEFPRAARLAEQALAETPAGGRARERFDATWLLAASLDPERQREAVRIYQQLLEAAAAGAPPHDPELQAALSLFLTTVVAGDPELAADLAERAIRGDAVTNDDGLGLAGDFALHTLLCCGKLQTLSRCAELRFEQVEHHASVMGAAAAACWRAHARLELGDLEGAMADAEVALVPSRYGWPVHSTYGGGALALARLEVGDAGGAAEAIRRIVEVPIPDPPRLYFTGVVEFALGRAARARELFERAGEDCLAHWGVDTPVLLPWRSAAALAAWRDGDEAGAVRLADAALAIAGETRLAHVLGRAMRMRGLVVGGVEGIDMLRAACDVLAGTDCRLEHLRVRVDLGGALRRSGARREARAVLGGARADAEALGCRALAHRAAQELSASGARPRRVPISGVQSLTPSERRIAELAATGLSNREIAAELFLTPKTVEWHLGHVFAKLGIRRRRELAATLSRTD
jgi:DNA-binding CsgD family transcriptional regulator/tetratricopeptide (TPR) repeat protein/energy-coupling factor transporter ATP-binding protein EcfA2